MTTTLNAGRLNPGFSVLGSLDKQQRRLNSSNSDPGNQPEQKETVHHLTPEEGAEIEEGIKKSEGTPGSPEQEQGSPISEVCFLFLFFLTYMLFNIFVHGNELTPDFAMVGP